MPERAVVTGVVIILIIALVVFAVELFVPISAKTDMNTYCRQALMQMEIEGGLSPASRQELAEKLADRGFENIQITADEWAALGGKLTLAVEADYKYSKLTAFFVRTEEVAHMVYKKTCIGRKVVN